MIVIYINGEGTATKLSPQHVYQGSNQTGVLVFAPVPPQTAMGIAFNLPDNTSTPYYPMTYQDIAEGLAQYEFTLPTSITQSAGQASIAIQATFSDGQQNSQLVDFEIEKSVVVVPPEPTPDVYDLLRQAIAKNASDIAGIQGQIDNIEDLAEKAEQASANAVNTANEAKATADGLADSIAQANTTAQQAVDTANGAVEDIAKYKSDTDGDIAQFKQTVNDEITQFESATDGKIESFENTVNGQIAEISATAQSAVSTANEAKQTADGIADSVAQANVTAGEAKEIAEEALEQSKVTGTKVNVNGEFQADLNFDSDPQTQIDGKVNKSGDILSGRLLIDQRNGGTPYFCVQVADNKWLQLQITPDGKLRGLYDGETNSWLIYFDENGKAHYADNEFGQQLRGYKDLANGATLNGEESGFYSNAYTIYSKSIKVGRPNGDGFALTWDFGGTYQYGLWLRVYNSGNLQYEQRIADGVSTPLAIDPSKLEPTTANGWTVGDKNLVLPDKGVYMVSITTSEDVNMSTFGGMPFIMILRNGVNLANIENFYGAAIGTNNSSMIGEPLLVYYSGGHSLNNGNWAANWYAKKLNSSLASVAVTQVAYKKLA